jgi:hypothetical protein
MAASDVAPEYRTSISDLSSIKESIAEFIRSTKDWKETGLGSESGEQITQASDRRVSIETVDLPYLVADKVTNIITIKSSRPKTIIKKSKSFPLRKVITREPSMIHLDSSLTTCGYDKRYVKSEATGRPNQVFVCSTCQAVRPKLCKILKHINVHNRGLPKASKDGP